MHTSGCSPRRRLSLAHTMQTPEPCRPWSAHKISVRLQVAKAKLAESPALMADLSTAMQALNETRCELDDMLTRMSAAGCVDACSSSSSSDCGDTKQAKPRAVTAADGVPTLLAQTSGTMSVCEGKACRRSAADEVYGLLHARAASNGVAVQRCKCLDQCKMGPNVKVEQPGTETIIVKGVTVECVPAEAEKEREAVLA